MERIFLFIVFLSFLGVSYSQDKGGFGGKEIVRRDTSKMEIEDDANIIEPIILKYYNISTPWILSDYKDTLLTSDFIEYDPIHKSVPFGNLGNLGAAAYPLLFQPSSAIGRRIFDNPFKLYHYSAEDIVFYKGKKPFTSTFYNQGNSNGNEDGKDFTQFKGIFGAKVLKDVYLSFDFNRINNRGEFLFQRTQNTNFKLGVHIDKTKYKGFFTLVTNKIAQQNNGGISSDTFYQSNLSQPISAPLRLSNSSAYTYSNDFEVGLYQKLYLIEGLNLQHKIKVGEERFKAFDKNPDSLYYRNLLVDNRGLRVFGKENYIYNEVGIGFENKLIKFSKFSIYLKNSKFVNEPDEFKEGIFGIKSQLQTTFREKFFLDFESENVLSQSVADFYAKAKVSTKTKLGEIGASVKTIFSSPSIFDEKLYVSGIEFRNVVLKSTKDKVISFDYKYNEYSSAKLNLISTAGYRYLDSNFTINQLDESLNIIQLHLHKDLHYRGFWTENSLDFQFFDSEIIRLPKFISHHFLYWKGFLFKKKLLLKTGAKLKIYSDFTPYNYNGLLGSFYLDSSGKNPVYYDFGVFMSFKIQTFRLFFQMENILPFFDDSKHFYFANPYPIFEGNTRFGVSWQFVD